MKNKGNESRLFLRLSGLLFALFLAELNAFGVQTAYASVRPLCDENAPLCTEVLDSLNYEGKYTGHDEPSLLFYSNVPGSGNSNVYVLTLPKDSSTRRLGSMAAGQHCDPFKWCAALNIDGLSENLNTGQVLNSTCQSVTGLEYVNFAFITKSGTPVGPPNPRNATSATFTPDPTKVAHEPR